MIVIYAKTETGRWEIKRANTFEDIAKIASEYSMWEYKH